MKNLKNVIDSLQNQVIKPKKIFVHIPRVYRRFPNVSFEIPDLSGYPNVEIVRCGDYGSATKFLPMMFIDEVKALRARGDLHADLPSMRCVGYRQAWEALDGTSPMAELRDKGVFATRQLAKRQITWLRSMPQRRIITCDDPAALQQVLGVVREVLA